MFQIGGKIVYRDEVCTVKDIAKKYKNDEDYYVLQSSCDPSLVIRVPVSKTSAIMRALMTKKDIDELIEKIPDIPVVPVSNWNRGSEYKDLLGDGSHVSIVSIIKTAYLRQQVKIERRQKANESDKLYFRQAERLLYNEIAAALDIPYDEAKSYIIQKVSGLAEQQPEEITV